MHDIYLVVLNRPDPGAWGRVDEMWRGRSYKLSDTVAFLRDETRTTQGIAEALGMGGPLAPGRPPVSGVVYAVSNAPYWGFNDTSLWEWIQKAKGS